MYPCLSGFPLSFSFFITRRPRVFCEIFATYRRYLSHRRKVVSLRRQSVRIYQTAPDWKCYSNQFDVGDEYPGPCRTGPSLSVIFQSYFHQCKPCHFHIVLVLFLRNHLYFTHCNRCRLWFVYRRVEPFRLFNRYAKLPIQSCLSSRLIALLSKAL